MALLLPFARTDDMRKANEGASQMSQVPKRARAWALLAALLAVSAGCGPVVYVHDVVIRARAAVAAAKTQEADKYAPYEYFGAAAYLKQAEVRAAYGDFLLAWRYGVKATKMAKKAVRLTKKRIEEKEDVGVTGSPPKAPRGVELPPATGSGK